MADRPGEVDPSNNRRWRLVIIAIFPVGIGLVALTVFSQIFPYSPQAESVPVPLEPGLVADYGTDPQTFRIPALRPAIITDIVRDSESEISSRHATLIANILTAENPLDLPTSTPTPSAPDSFQSSTNIPPPPDPAQTPTPTPTGPPSTKLPTESATSAPSPTPTLRLEKPTVSAPTLEISPDPGALPTPTPTLEIAPATPLSPKTTPFPTSSPTL